MFTQEFYTNGSTEGVKLKLNLLYMLKAKEVAFKRLIPKIAQ